MGSLLRLILTLGLVALGPARAGVQTYPAKPIRIIVSTSPGGITDFIARVLGAHITARTGAPVVIDNRPGASGNIAMEAVARAAPDGYTLGFGNTGNIAINPFLFSNMPFDPLTDLVPVGPVGTVPLFLVINSSLPCKTLADFIAYAKAHPETVNYAGAGAGTTPDLAGEEFIRRAGLHLVVVPFKGTAPATTAVISGEVQATFISMGPHIDMVRTGTLRVLAAATPKREPYAPDTPTFAELGFPGFETSTWFSLFAPRGTPDKIVAQLNSYTRSVHEDAEAERRLDANFVDQLKMTPAEIRALVKADAAKWQAIVRRNGIKPQ
ncbi:MAG TPA: tripartite tricarboxylate transporter substrate binding protein [Xanthobacteraceae bacterium]|jgi:tripartite-type tricarboxylate transporter receptor subunit TctC|nr:tripartite tricarboxylate transporter substrate binding protein [Xanthobacteraceae bacterium]